MNVKDYIIKDNKIKFKWYFNRRLEWIDFPDNITEVEFSNLFNQPLSELKKLPNLKKI
jgi:hypothetical protein